MAPQSTLNKDTEIILLALQAFPNGALIEDIEQKTALNLPRRTLQRRLQRLQVTGQIQVNGKTRATRYQLINSESKLVFQNKETQTEEPLIPLTKQAKETYALVNAPIQKRTPVGYNRDFLDSYQPNVSHYLTTQEIEKLTTLGQINKPNLPAGTYVKEILNRLLIDLSWNSSRLEGNTYSLLDTQNLLAFGQAAKNKSTIEAQMILNHKDAIEFLVRSSEDIAFNNYTLLNLHALLSDNLLPDPDASGRLRHIAVGIAHSVYQPLAIPQDIASLFNLILQKANQINNPFEQAFFIMVHLPYLQPFDDVNKRVSRLASNIPFAKHNLSPLSFVDVPDDLYIAGMIGVYELNRYDLLKAVFIWAYQRSSARYATIRQTIGEPDPLRLKYRDLIRQLIADIITHALPHAEAAAQIQTQAKALPQADQSPFIEAVETELLSVHEGNFARFQVRPTVFKAWQVVWRRSKLI